MRKLLSALSVVISVSLFWVAYPSASEKLGLLVIAHGSPADRWNEPVLRLEKEVKSLLSMKEETLYDEVRVAFMEFSEPSVASAVRYMEEKGVERIFVVPLFIAPSGHSHFDVPAILGAYYERNKFEELKEEGTEMVDTRIKITTGPTLSAGSILKEIVLDRVREISTNPGDESLVILAHGDNDFRPVWERVCTEVGSYVCAGTGIPYFDFALVEIGQSFFSEGVPVIDEASSKSKRTLVVGLYLMLSAEEVAYNTTMNFGRMKLDAASIFGSGKVIFSKKAVLPDRRISKWIVEKAMEYADYVKHL